MTETALPGLPKTSPLGGWSTGGCGAKLGRSALLDLLGQADDAALPRELLVGLNDVDDAAVWAIDAERALVATLDFAPPASPEPGLAGAIAAINALNDVWACGAAPALCLNIVGLAAEGEVGAAKELLDSIAETARGAGALVVGGHTIRAAEPLFGLAAIGFVDQDRIWTISGARPGDVLLLTKPLGTGVLISQARRNPLAAEAMTELIDELTLPHGSAVDALAALAVHGATDVSGFGLAGHAASMADASGVTIELFAERLPLYEHSKRLLESGAATSLTAENEADAGARVSISGDVPPLARAALHDPQTAGPLLISIAEDDADQALKALRDAGCAATAAVGRVAERGGAALVVRGAEPS